MCETDFNQKKFWGAEGGSGFLKENIFDSEITYYILTCIIVIFLPNLCFVFVHEYSSLFTGVGVTKRETTLGFFQF